MRRGQQDQPDDGRVDMTCGIDEGRSLYNINDSVKDEAERIGIGSSPRPRLDEVHTRIFPGTEPGHYFDGRMPTVVKSLTLDQLSQLHSLLQSWYNYLAHQQAMWKMRCSAAKQIADNTEACLRGLYKADGHSDQNARDMAAHDHRFAEDNVELEKAKAIFLLVEAAVKSANHNIDLVTQELITRGVVMKSNMGGQNFNRNLGYAARMEQPPIPESFGGNHAEATGKVQPPKGPATARAEGSKATAQPRKSRWG